ncbi:serine hydrolase domain-containing protein [Chloroflexota bacterium]
MAVETPDGVWIGAAGKADLATGQAMTADMQVRIASITKMFTAVLIMKLVEENRVSLDDTVEQWLPGAVHNGDNITVAMLLNHTSGIPDYADDMVNYWDRVFATPTEPWSSADILELIRNQEAHFAPGTEWRYCNAGYYLLGMIAEAATGNNLADEMNRRFFEPLGMSRTALTRAGMKTEPYACDYCWVGAHNELEDTSLWDMSSDWTAGSAVTTAGDMLIWTRALFGEQVISIATLSQMTTPVLPSTQYGYGIGKIDNDPFFGDMLLTHSGESEGIHAIWLHYPGTGRTIFVSLNRHDYPTPPEPPPVDTDAVMTSIFNGVRDILNG